MERDRSLGMSDLNGAKRDRKSFWQSPKSILLDVQVFQDWSLKPWFFVACSVYRKRWIPQTPPQWHRVLSYLNKDFVLQRITDVIASHQ
jgi:hypothetical protein